MSLSVNANSTTWAPGPSNSAEKLLTVVSVSVSVNAGEPSIEMSTVMPAARSASTSVQP